MPATRATLTWTQTAALNPRMPICASCGADLTLKPSSGVLRRCRSCRSPSPLAPLLSLPRRVDRASGHVAGLAA